MNDLKKQLEATRDAIEHAVSVLGWTEATEAALEAIADALKAEPRLQS
jgi:hypothetical protein